jgi:hypothetical protein
VPGVIVTHFSSAGIAAPSLDKRRLAGAPRVPSRNPQQRAAHYAHYLMRPIFRFGPLAFAAIVICTIVFAFIERDEGHLSAESGIGYWLGIAGAVIMLTLIGYPLRKRWRVLHTVGRVANWFRLHMILGIIGPTFVILHTNFKLGSLNSRLALFTMLIVVASGIIGRYLYAKVHKGLYGKQAQMRDVLSDVATLRQGLGDDFAGLAGIERELSRYVPDANARPRSLLAGFFSALSAGSRTQSSRRRILRDIRINLSGASQLQSMTRRQKRARIKDIDSQLKFYFAAVKKAERLAFFERLFGMWHHLHVPLFVLLVLTVTFHVVAVHRY